MILHCQAKRVSVLSSYFLPHILETPVSFHPSPKPLFCSPIAFVLLALQLIFPPVKVYQIHSICLHSLQLILIQTFKPESESERVGVTWLNTILSRLVHTKRYRLTLFYLISVCAYQVNCNRETVKKPPRWSLHDWGGGGGYC